MRIYIFCSTDQIPDWLSKSRMRFQKSNYSHVGIVVVLDGEHIILFDGKVFHSTGEGMNEISCKDFIHKKKKKFVELFDITEYVLNTDRALGWIEGNKGKDYSESQYVAIILSKLGLGWLGKRFYDGSSELVCSEFVYLFLKENSSLEEFKNMVQDLVTPRDVIDTLRIKVKGFTL